MAGRSAAADGDELLVGSDQVTITVIGAELARTECFTGPRGSTDRCPIEPDGDAYRTEVDHLADHEAVTVAGDITSFTPADAPEPETVP